MQINYRVLSIDEKECSVVVRYWTDKLSERELSVNPDEQNDLPERCRTDYNLNLWDLGMSEDELHNYLLSCAPVGWFKLKGQLKDKNGDTALSRVRLWVGINRGGATKEEAESKLPSTWLPSTWPTANEVDITPLLDAGG
jgi:hypothetical protein